MCKVISYVIVRPPLYAVEYTVGVGSTVLGTTAVLQSHTSTKTNIVIIAPHFQVHCCCGVPLIPASAPLNSEVPTIKNYVIIIIIVISIITSERTSNTRRWTRKNHLHLSRSTVPLIFSLDDDDDDSDLQ